MVPLLKWRCCQEMGDGDKALGRGEVTWMGHSGIQVGARLRRMPCRGRARSAPVPRLDRLQITGVVRGAARRRDIQHGMLHDLFSPRAVGTGDVPHHKPVGFALRPVGPAHEPNDIFRAVHPPAQLLIPLPANCPYLVFIAMIVCHLFSPRRRIDADFILDPRFLER